jgi:alpha-D-ribose 1-methylphosphonate 5-triphosphate synthase subunit PhnG
MSTQAIEGESLQRSEWMSILAKAPTQVLAATLDEINGLPGYQFLRSPETGLTMVRGRAEGTGQVFNLGEMTLTRCVIQLNGVGDENGSITGFGYVGGRSHRHAELAALCDALLQHPVWQAKVQTQVIEPLKAAAQHKRTADAAEVEATRVNFFTLLRGES